MHGRSLSPSTLRTADTAWRHASFRNARAEAGPISINPKAHGTLELVDPLGEGLLAVSIGDNTAILEAGATEQRTYSFNASLTVEASQCRHVRV